MRPSLRFLNSVPLGAAAAAQESNAHHFYKPLIRFVGKREWPSKPEEQHPHPFAPPELKQSFGEFIKKFQSSSSSSSSPAPSQAASGGAPKKSHANAQVYDEFWLAPQRLWKRDLTDWEIKLVQSGGASAHK